MSAAAKAGIESREALMNELVPRVMEQIQSLLILKAGSWQAVSELASYIPARLAEEASQGTNPADWGELDPVAFGRAKLACHAVQTLEYYGAIETRLHQGQRQIRLIGPPVLPALKRFRAQLPSRHENHAVPSVESQGTEEAVRVDPPPVSRRQAARPELGSKNRPATDTSPST